MLKPLDKLSIISGKDDTQHILSMMREYFLKKSCKQV
jgi:hypothetical protein